MATTKKDTTMPADIDALAASRFRPAVNQNNADAKAAFGALIGGEGFDSLTESGKAAFRSFATVDALAQNPNSIALDPALEEKWKGAMQACLDAVRDARMAGFFDSGTSAPDAPDAVATSKDPEVKNQAPTGTVGETAGPIATVAPAKNSKT